MIKALKFGGTSMADGNILKRVKEIVESDPARRFVVVSAPGKRYGGDSKVTDLLYAAHTELHETGALGAAFSKVRERFLSLAREAGLTCDTEALLDETAREITEQESLDFTVSRGEYLTARLVAELLGAEFIDAKDIIKFRADGKLDELSFTLTAAALKDCKRAVIPGFYGSLPSGAVKTFSRGGSDVSGAIVARAVGADLYENWTDVSGFLACDPHIVDDPERIPALSYQELRELSYMGANVLHSESIFPVREADIPISIKNTFRPDDEGTLILPPSKYQFTGRTVTGIAGKKHFTVILLEKSLMNAEIGFTYRVLAVLYRYGISFEHIPSGIDTMSFIIDSAVLGGGVLERLCGEIREAAKPDSLHVYEDVALIAVVGHGMSRNVGTSARLFGAVAAAGVNVRMIDQGSSELNIIVGVDSDDYERTVRAVYREFFAPYSAR